MEITEEQRKRIAHGWETIGLILLKHQKDFDPNEWALMVKASGEFRNILHVSDKDEWPSTTLEQWEAKK